MTLRPVFTLERDGTLSQTLIAKGTFSNISPGYRARFVRDVALAPGCIIPKGSKGRVEHIDRHNGNLYLDVDGEQLALMPFECDADMICALRLRSRAPSVSAASCFLAAALLVFTVLDCVHEWQEGNASLFATLAHAASPGILDKSVLYP
jgi:hypothetical protein